MSEMALNKSGTEFRRGFQAGVTIAIGYFPVALTFGLLAKTTGLSLGETLLMSLVVYAGAAQYISLSLLTLGTGTFEIVLTTFIVNIRHFLMAASLNEKSEEEPPLIKAGYAFGITDETFSVAAVKEGTVSAGYMFGLNMIAYLSWGVFSGVGYIVGSSLPKTFQEGMSVALYAMFVGLLVPSMKKGMKVVYLAVLAALFNTVFTVTNALSTGWAIVVATLLSAVIVEWLVFVKGKERGMENEK
ncbi:AzlC family ABC transporter permease [Robertmurraya massiliosenegalensis]|uniref:AzlC family ABC transporter permease n=1 Tax=Robertmurraya TaxID=2837507 RepID=UPI0039A61C1E